MYIKSIKWGGRNVDEYNNGINYGSRYRCSTATVTENGNIEQIVEESPTIYSIHYKDGQVVRIINPIEVLFAP